MWKKALLAILGLFIVIQFIRPEKNEGTLDNSDDISKIVNVPADIQLILKTSCYDCHSNKTSYPFYSQIMPFGWWLNHHVEEGKEQLNFSVFGAYSKERQDHKLEETKEEAQEGEMPLSSYTFLHPHTKLTKEQITALSTWVEGAREELSTN